ncbi:hypothetical protein IW262DRAFT_1514647 [Armillaria fumosa]|nr:hypothetical protein IW262DRAFT_1514647 [Armillaria fumosa]
MNLTILVAFDLAVTQLAYGVSRGQLSSTQEAMPEHLKVVTKEELHTGGVLSESTLWSRHTLGISIRNEILRDGPDWLLRPAPAMIPVWNRGAEQCAGVTLQEDDEAHMFFSFVFESLEQNVELKKPRYSIRLRRLSRTGSAEYFDDLPFPANNSLSACRSILSTYLCLNSRFMSFRLGIISPRWVSQLPLNKVSLLCAKAVLRKAQALRSSHTQSQGPECKDFTLRVSSNQQQSTIGVY